MASRAWAIEDGAWGGGSDLRHFWGRLLYMTKIVADDGGLLLAVLYIISDIAEVNELEPLASPP